MRPRLVLLIDVSRSMAPYSFFYLRLARALSAELADVQSFIFHTRIRAVSQALHDQDPWRAQERLQLIAQGWGGGTRIGESIAQFNREHAPRIVHSRTAMIVMSDGYDTGEPTLLSNALAQLKRRARRIVWLNPLAGRPGYAPISQGMQAALPHLDLLAPGADLGEHRTRCCRRRDRGATIRRSIMGCLLKANGLYSRMTTGAVLLAAGAARGWAAGRRRCSSWAACRS